MESWALCLVRHWGVSGSGFVVAGAPNASPDYFILAGPTPNDQGDADSGPNNLINSPQLKGAIQDGTELTVTYDLDVIG